MLGGLLFSQVIKINIRAKVIALNDSATFTVKINSQCWIARTITRINLNDLPCGCSALFRKIISLIFCERQKVVSKVHFHSSQFANLI